MALTNNDQLANRLGLLRSHGITRDSALMTEPIHGPWHYQQVDLGFNYRMTDIQAALGVSQMKRLEGYVIRRHQIAQKYNDLLADLPLTLPWQDPSSISAYHLYVIRLQLDRITLSHREVFEALRAREIMVNLHYIPVHTQPYYQEKGFNYGDYPSSETYYRESISIPIYPAMTDLEQIQTAKALREIVG